MRTEYRGSILLIRDLEDTIRATRKYTKGAFSKTVNHPIQGEQFPSKVLTEYYEVYPDMEPGWDMRAGDAWAWVWGDVMHIDITFLYDYRADKAKVTVHGGRDAMAKLKSGIPEFKSILDKIVAQQDSLTKADEPKATDNGSRVTTPVAKEQSSVH